MSVLEMKEGNIARLTITVEKDAFVKAEPTKPENGQPLSRAWLPQGKSAPQGH